jgi:hypothetical protein
LEKSQKHIHRALHRALDAVNAHLERLNALGALDDHGLPTAFDLVPIHHGTRVVIRGRTRDGWSLETDIETKSSPKTDIDLEAEETAHARRAPVDPNCDDELKAQIVHYHRARARAQRSLGRGPDEDITEDELLVHLAYENRARARARQFLGLAPDAPVSDDQLEDQIDFENGVRRRLRESRGLWPSVAISDDDLEAQIAYEQEVRPGMRRGLGPDEGITEGELSAQMESLRRNAEHRRQEEKDAADREWIKALKANLGVRSDDPISG